MAKPASEKTVNGSATDDSVLTLGASVLEQESEALRTLARSLGVSFSDAIALIEKTSGRVIVTGMGKSGHVARKIAATLSSTGTPAFFVHPAEASHGDLGMVTEKDVVLALSNSGNAPELASIIAYTRRFRIPLMGMTSRSDSVLAKESDIVLLMPAVPEACPLGLAPTTSTTMMMALGDALAVALLKKKNFTVGHFKEFHPGGSLGKRLVKVADIMHSGSSIPLVGQQARMADAILQMTAKGFGSVGVVDDQGKLCGIITDGDLRRHMGSSLLEQKVHDVMTSSPRTISEDALAEEALALMNLDGRPVTSLFVTRDQMPVGFLHIHDCLRAGIV